MKKCLILLMVVLLALSLTGCFGWFQKKDENLIGVAMPTQSLQRWNQDGANMKAKLEEKGYKVDLQYANNDVNTQIQQLENMITKKCKVLVIASIDGSALTEVLRKAAENNIKVIAYDRLIMNSEHVDYYATFDNFQVGVIQGKYIEEKLGLKTNAGPFNIELFAGSPDDNNAYFFNGGAMSILQPYIDEGKLIVPSKQTEFTTIAIHGWDSADAQARMDNLITAHYAGGRKLDAVLSPNDSLAIGIVTSLKNAGYGTADKPFPVITGQDCDKANVIAMINGEQSMSIFKDTRTLAAQVVDMVEAIMKGEEAPVNDTKTYNNGVKYVPSFLCEPVYADVNNYKELLIDSGYYTEADLQQ
ncbi:MAG TPA: sugar ABC transporter substrate-binding protein [Firmicutes bacterium]|jgi:putative multiple sugar transport system substrate-binding protein|nr:sugar ABC transporter substrate-binding protein [Bacillota bacterium]